MDEWTRGWEKEAKRKDEIIGTRNEEEHDTKACRESKHTPY